MNIVDWYGNNQKELIKASGPGHWNDPDMVSACAIVLQDVEFQTGSLIKLT